MTTIDPHEIEKFSKIADEWWDETGKFKPLHQFNPIRLHFIKNQICDFFGRDKNLLNPLTSLKILDIGCGGGLVAEPICRLGGDLTAIDASEKNIKIAQIHAQKSGLNINYQTSSAEQLAENIDQDTKFDVILALEIIEHVADVDKFIEACAKLLKKDGILFIATLNRTPQSLLMAKFGVEYILRWLPIGTHDWRKFLKPSEIDNIAQNYLLKLQKIQGFTFNIFKNEWSLSNDLAINYCMVFKNS